MAAPKTVATYDMNGSAREFDFPFDYLSRGFVKVTIIGTVRRTLTVGTDYTFVAANRIRTNLIYGPPGWAQIEIRRQTSTTERLVDFQDASILRADDLDLSQLQVLHVAEEAREAATETIGTNNFGHLDARGRRIVNVIDPVDPLDAVNRRWYEADVNGVYQSRVASEQARDKAKEWATSPNPVAPGLESSKSYAERAKASETTAIAASSTSAGSAASSSASAGAASASAGSALNHANAASVSASAASSSASAASSSASAASSSASAASSSAAASLTQANRAKAEADRAGTNATLVDTTFLRDRANHTGTQPASTISGLGTAAFAASQVSLNDPSVGSLMAVGAFGLGGVELAWPSTSFNYTRAPTGFYRATNSVTEAPETGEYWGVLVELAPDGEYLKQTVWGLNNKRSYVRVITGGVAGPWRQIMTSLECGFSIIGPAVPKVAVNSRYVLDNPFGNSQVICVAEIFTGNSWIDTGWIYANGGYGVKASQLGTSIVIQTGSLALAGSSADSGNPAGILSYINAQCPCRVKVWKVNS